MSSLFKATRPIGFSGGIFDGLTFLPSLSPDGFILWETVFGSHQSYSRFKSRSPFHFPCGVIHTMLKQF